MNPNGAEKRRNPCTFTICSKKSVLKLADQALSSPLVFSIMSLIVSYNEEWHLIHFFPKVSKMKLFIYFSRKHVLQKVNFLQTSSPFCTLYYIKWYPNSLFPYSPSLSRPKNCKFGGITVPRNGFYFWYLYKI